MIKTVSDTEVIMHQLVLPNDANLLGNVLGGRVMHLMDVCAAMSAYRHARSPVVTASVDNLDFLAPAKVGDILILKSSVNYTSKTSMEVGVRIESESPLTSTITHTASAFLTFVSLIDNKPAMIKTIVPQTEVQKRRFSDGEKRSEQRKKRLIEIRKKYSAHKNK